MVNKKLRGERKRISLKEARFVKEYVRNKGNASQAVIAAGYNVSKPANASVIGHEMLAKPRIQTLMAEELDRIGYTTGSIAEDLQTIIQAGINYNLKRTTTADSLKGIDMALKLRNLYPSDKAAPVETKNLRVELKAKSPKELKQYLKELQTESDKWLEP